MSQSWVKTEEELVKLKKSGAICAQVLKEVLLHVKVGVTCSDLDDVAQREIKKRAVLPSFTTVDDYKWAICTTVNQQVVHGIPGNRTLKDSDIVGVDIGVIYEGYHSDMATTVTVGNVSDETKKFLKDGKNILERAISRAKAGNTIGDISAEIEKGVTENGYSTVRELTGHGVGKSLHEDPPVPGFGKRGTGPKLRKNMVLAIEVIYTNGSGKIKIEDDGWTISSADGSLGGLFEKTVVITNSRPIVLTSYL